MPPEDSLPNPQMTATCPILSQLDPVHTPAFQSKKINLNIILTSTPGFPHCPLSLRFPTKILYTPLPTPIHATRLTQLIYLDFITRTIKGEEYKSLSSSLSSIPHYAFTSSLVSPNFLLNILFSDTLNLRSSLNVSDQVSHP